MKTLTAPFNAAKSRPRLNFAQRSRVGEAMVPSPLRIGNGKWLCMAGLFLAPALLLAQQYSIDWYKIAGGGGTSTGGVFSVSGTIGQPDASGSMSGGNYSMTGGFWAIYAVQTAGAPLLTITHVGNQAVISWDSSTTGWTLQTNANLSTPTWGSYLGTVVNNSVTNAPPKGNVFFRLTHP